MNAYITRFQGELEAVTDFFKKDIASIRTGRANPALLDGVMVEMYGTKMPLQQVANISVSDATSMVVKPWDKSSLKEIEKAIVVADIGVNPVNEGEQIRISLPQPTEEDRKNRVKKLNEKLEHARVSIRQVREQIKKAIEQAGDEGDISEDEQTRFLKEMEEEIKKRGDELQAIRDRKEKDIMTI